MAKDDPTESREKKERREKKEKKRKHSETAAATGIADDAMEVEVVAERSKKKDKKRKSTLENETSAGDAVDVDLVKDESGEEEKVKDGQVVKMDVPLAALVPFANPLCDEKALRKVLKGVKKAAKHRALKRGVKECVKSIRKSPLAQPHTSPTALPIGIVVLAADISPMDVISHIPVLCEDHGIPYVYVPSRVELGAAGSTKRPTSVVLLTLNRSAGGKKEGGGEGGDGEGQEWEESYRELYQLVLRLGQFVKV